MSAYEDSMLSDSHAAETIAKILDDRSQPVDAYNPDGFESLETYVLQPKFSTVS